MFSVDSINESYIPVLCHQCFLDRLQLDVISVGSGLVEWLPWSVVEMFLQRFPRTWLRHGPKQSCGRHTFLIANNRLERSLSAPRRPSTRSPSGLGISEIWTLYSIDSFRRSAPSRGRFNISCILYIDVLTFPKYKKELTGGHWQRWNSVCIKCRTEHE